MDIIFNSFLLVAATEMGDKTQLLAFVLASRFKRPLVVMAGIFTATILNHSCASFVGYHTANLASPYYLKIILALIFFAFAIWILIPDKDGEDKSEVRFGAFLTTTVLFFLAEMGDKTQLSTVALAAKYHDMFLVTIGTTLGMIFSDGLAVIFGEKINSYISMKYIRYASALLYLVFGVTILMGY